MRQKIRCWSIGVCFALLALLAVLAVLALFKIQDSRFKSQVERKIHPWSENFILYRKQMEIKSKSLAQWIEDHPGTHRDVFATPNHASSWSTDC